MSQLSEIEILLLRYGKKTFGRLLLEKLLLGCGILALYVVLSVYLNDYQLWLLAGLSAFAILLIAVPLARARGKFTKANMAEHFNRHIDELEDSMQLLVSPSNEYSVLQQLQKEKVANTFMALHGRAELAKTLPYIRWRSTFWLTLTALLLFFTLGRLPDPLTNDIPSVVSHSTPVQLLQMQIEVFPPRYTGLKPSVHEAGDIEIIEGSKIRWQMHFSNNKRQYRLDFDGQTSLPLTVGPNDRFIAEMVVNRTGLYSIISAEERLPGVYAISVSRDQMPRIRLIEPDTSLVEIAKDGKPEFAIKAQVQDDFALSEVTILASVAKGSGEAVKFRDQTFQFDGFTSTGVGRVYEKQWDLIDLGMESGDEVYFTIIAKDNKPGTPQEARSNTVIVRWLDEIEEVLAVEGISLNYMPEYFRSQRQIIIETEQLLSDQDELSQSAFQAQSLSLGHSQGDLKLRYGQYLGVEQEEAAGAWGGSVAAQEAEPEHQEEHDHEHEHDHGNSTGLATGADIGNQQLVVSQFAHTHEDVHIGEVSSQNPKAMMKKAVGFMWQAELHLMLHEPQKALPFEKQAYKYLKLAQQAERIYVKRLGFEPPPVSEERRLTGELDDIDSYGRHEQVADLSEDVQELFRQSFAIVNQQSQQLDLTAAQSEQLRKTKQQLTEMAQERPALIRQAATLERMLITNSLQLSDCEGCVQSLSQKLWQLIDSNVGRPIEGQRNYINSDPLVVEYMQRMPGGGQR